MPRERRAEVKDFWAADQEWRPKLPPQSFTYALLDLSEDGIADAVVLIDDPRYRGCSGCALLILHSSAETAPDHFDGFP